MAGAPGGALRGAELALKPLFVSNPVFESKGYGHHHPLAIARVGPVVDICRTLGWLHEGNYRQSTPATLESLRQFHTPDYLEALATVSAGGQATGLQRQRYGLGTMENPVFPRLLERVAASVGGSMLAADLAMAGRVVFHPAGGTHHGRPGRASGFCYSNDPVFAIRTFLGHGLKRVAYLDLDAHHGDGVEDAFNGDARVLCVSLHEEGRWPGTGQGDTATARNHVVKRGFDDAGLRALVAYRIVPEISAFAPEALVLTCGADVLRGDPLSSMQLSNRALWNVITQVLKLAPRAVVLGGGGYNPWTTVRYWAGLWAVLAGHDIPAALPESVTALLGSFTCDLVDDEDIDAAWLISLADQSEEAATHETA